jgi:hypothetical protein
MKSEFNGEEWETVAQGQALAALMVISATLTPATPS